MTTPSGLIDPVFPSPTNTSISTQVQYVAAGAMQSVFQWWADLTAEADSLEGTTNTREAQAAAVGLEFVEEPKGYSTDDPFSVASAIASQGYSATPSGVDFSGLSFSNPFDSPAKEQVKPDVKSTFLASSGTDLIDVWEAVWGQDEDGFAQDPLDIVEQINSTVTVDPKELVYLDPSDYGMYQKYAEGRNAAGHRAFPQAQDAAQLELEAILKAYQDAINAAGRGGGGPRYQAPDRRAVDEAVENQMILLTGRIDPQLVSSITDDYMRDDRRRFEGASVDPNQTLMERIRQTAEYEQIHEGRPDSAPENTWVSNQRNAFLQGGGTMHSAEQRGIDLATVGAAPTTESAGIFEASRSNIVPQFFEKLTKASSFAASKVN